jgi:hypothetical protein
MPGGVATTRGSLLPRPIAGTSQDAGLVVELVNDLMGETGALHLKNLKTLMHGQQFCFGLSNLQPNVFLLPLSARRE